MEKQIKNYQKLNNIALKNGVVLFGESIDTEIPASELAQSFEFDYAIYNRSFLELNLDNSIAIYESCIKSLMPDTLLIHIGANDFNLFNEDKALFEQKYIALIEHIKKADKKCRIVVVSIDIDNDSINQELKYIADSTKCEFGDLSTVKVWNPQATKGVTSFVQTMGVRRYCKNKPIYDILKILFCY